MEQKFNTEGTSLMEEGLALKFLIQPPKIKTSKQKAIILLHGVGSNEEDLFSLAKYLPADFWIISPRGYYTLGTGRYAWYEVGFSSGTPEINSLQEENSRKIIIQFIEQLKNKYQIEDIYLGGFSQGAIMSYSIGLTDPKILKGIIALSGRILHEIRPGVVNNPQLQQLKVFIAHGSQDGTLPVFYAKEAIEYLKQLNINPEYHEFQMGHQISNDVLDAINKWLTANQ